MSRHNPRRHGDNGRIQHVIVDLPDTVIHLRTPWCPDVRLAAAKQN
ncbi:hypothetical protein ARTSIC4J27_4469 [Pseudarthrobacter siccitolerans]|uniref:Uncharacterized protein n=1 Tax=Pseudarthrobacter siccitolerans TaxID=861266 RepID=A0A024H9C6_9MICC|nr:hypothetical protein ARTSIC4J27_4469 [Pseudarthrobacter siccitolerans]